MHGLTDNQNVCEHGAHALFSIIKRQGDFAFVWAPPEHSFFIDIRAKSSKDTPNGASGFGTNRSLNTFATHLVNWATVARGRRMGYAAKVSSKSVTSGF